MISDFMDTWCVHRQCDVCVVYVCAYVHVQSNLRVENCLVRTINKFLI